MIKALSLLSLALGLTAASVAAQPAAACGVGHHGAKHAAGATCCVLHSHHASGQGVATVKLASAGLSDAGSTRLAHAGHDDRAAHAGHDDQAGHDAQDAHARHAGAHPAADKPAVDAKAPFETVTAIQVPDLVGKRGAVLIDVREVDEFAAGHPAGAKSMPLSQIETWAPKLDPAATYLFSCRSGHRSAKACARVTELGLKHVKNVDGGFTAWEKAGLPVEKQAEPAVKAEAKPAAPAQPATKSSVE